MTDAHENTQSAGIKAYLDDDELEAVLKGMPGDPGYYATSGSASADERATNRFIIAERRAKVAKMMHARIPRYVIAETLGLTMRQVNYDIKWLKKQWQSEALEDVTAQYEQELEELAIIEARMNAQFLKTKNPGYVDRILKIKEQRAKLLGLYRPSKVALTDPTGEQAYDHLSSEELDGRIAALIDKLGIGVNEDS